MRTEINLKDLDGKLEQVLSETVEKEFGIDTKQPAAREAVRSLSTALHHLPPTMLTSDVQRLIYKTLFSDREGGTLHEDEFHKLDQTEKIRRLQSTSKIVYAVADVLSQLD